MTIFVVICWLVALIMAAPVLGQSKGQLLKEVRIFANLDRPDLEWRDFSRGQHWTTPKRIDWASAAKSFGAAEDTVHLIQQASDGQLDGRKPHSVLLWHLVNSGLRQLPMAPIIGEHLPRMEISGDVNNFGKKDMAVWGEIKIFFPAGL